MGPVRRLVYVSPGVGMCFGAWFLGAPIPFVAASIIIFFGGAFLPATPRAGALVVAPILIATGSPAPGLLDPATVAWSVLSVAALAPLFLFLGAGIPWRGLLVYFVGLTVFVVGTIVIPGAPSMYSSDIATRSQILLLAAATILLGTIAPWVRFRRNEKPTEENIKPSAQV